jgi:hypothetical protein
MSKRPSLAEGMRAVASEPAPPTAPPQPPAREPATAPKPLPAISPATNPDERPTGYYAATRAGKKKATAPLSTEAHRQLKSLAVEQGGTVERLLIEAINDLFRKYDKPPIA